MTTNFPSRARLFALAPLAVLLAACGGGGDSGSDGGGPAPVGLAITSTNATAAAGDGLTNSTNTAAAQAGAGVVTGVQVEETAAIAPPPALAIVALARKAAAAGLPANLVTGVAIDQTVNCTGGGTMRVTGNVQSGNGLTAGDQITVSAANCRETVEGAMTTMNGAMQLQIVSGSVGSTFPFQVTMQTTTQNFSVAAGTTSTRTNGDMRMALSATSATLVSMVNTGDSIATAVTGTAGSLTATWKNYRQEISTTATTVTTALGAVIETRNSRIGSGTVRYTLTTPTHFVSSTNGTISAGVLQMVGVNSQLRLSVTAANTFSLQVDADGNGTYESTSTKTLAELGALL